MATRQMISFLVLSISILSVSSQVFLSIDCGSLSSDPYIDENLISWTGDNNYIKTGESHVIQSNNLISRVMDTLRAFTTRNKNCYYIDSIRRGRVLIRASFYYGNYDNRSSPPRFDLQFDGNHWVTVETSMTDNIIHEVIYVMKEDSISVCVAQTEGGQIPFISAIEIRRIESYMYANAVGNHTENYPMFLRRRDAFGSNSTIRYADDPYDRIWSPVGAGNGITQLTSNTIFSGFINALDEPPPAALRNAIAGVTPNTTINLFMGFPPVGVRAYINFYFTEVSQLQPNETRSFQIFMGGESFSTPILPPFGNCTQWWVRYTNATSNTTVSLVPTNDSTLPPLINAMEVFFIGNELTNGTNTNDAEGLASLQKAFVVLEDWKGDPCLPAPYSWDWIQCSNHTTPRVTALLLSSFGLSGILPDFSSMDALQTIELHNNSLQGPIPNFLGTLPNLRELNLANNRFNGSIPASLSRINGLNYIVTGNPELCTSDQSSCPNSDSSRNETNLDSGSSKKIYNLIPVMFGTIASSIVFLFTV